VAEPVLTVRVHCYLNEFLAEPNERKGGLFASFLEYVTGMTDINNGRPDRPAIDLGRAIGFSAAMLMYLVQLAPAQERAALAEHVAAIIASGAGPTRRQP